MSLLIFLLITMAAAKCDHENKGNTVLLEARRGPPPPPTQATTSADTYYTINSDLQVCLTNKERKQAYSQEGTNLQLYRKVEV